jgi:PPOX class probable FMN-dependent enzyme
VSKSEVLQSEDDLRTVYRHPSAPIKNKAFPSLDKHSRRFIELSPFFCIGTMGSYGADVSPRGGEPGFVHVLDDMRIAFPDRPGNNRLDTLTNLVKNSEAGLLFFVPGIDETLRLNGTASMVTDKHMRETFLQGGKLPRSVVVIKIREVYFHCSKALRRSDLWNSEKQIDRASFPTLGQIVKDQYGTIVPAALIDFALKQDAKKNLY